MSSLGITLWACLECLSTHIIRVLIQTIPTSSSSLILKRDTSAIPGSKPYYESLQLKGPSVYHQDPWNTAVSCSLGIFIWALGRLLSTVRALLSVWPKWEITITIIEVFIFFHIHFTRRHAFLSSDGGKLESWCAINRDPQSITREERNINYVKMQLTSFWSVTMNLKACETESINWASKFVSLMLHIFALCDTEHVWALDDYRTCIYYISCCYVGQSCGNLSWFHE